jgi:hypothetical protein
MLIRRAAFDRYGTFNPDVIMLSDWEYAARVATNTGLAYVDATLAHFRMHEESATAHIRRQRGFRAAAIDPVVILHELCYSRHYAGVRAAARRQEPPVDLVALLSAAVREVPNVLRALPDPRGRAEWARMLWRYPRLVRPHLAMGVRAWRRRCRV